MLKHMKTIALCVATVAVVALPMTSYSQSTVSNSRTTTLQKNEHAIGITTGFLALGANGIAYRRYFGNNFAQFSLFPLYTSNDNGNEGQAFIWGSASVGRYLVVIERPGVYSWFSPTIALRTLANVAGSIGSVTTSNFDGPGGQASSVTKPSRRLWVGGGMGVEFGGVSRYGLSMTVDLLLTAEFNMGGFQSLLPLPHFSAMFSW